MKVRLTLKRSIVAFLLVVAVGIGSYFAYRGPEYRAAFRAYVSGDSISSTDSNARAMQLKELLATARTAIAAHQAIVTFADEVCTPNVDTPLSRKFAYSSATYKLATEHCAGARTLAKVPIVVPPFLMTSNAEHLNRIVEGYESWGAPESVVAGMFSELEVLLADRTQLFEKGKLIQTALATAAGLPESEWTLAEWGRYYSEQRKLAIETKPISDEISILDRQMEMFEARQKQISKLLDDHLALSGDVRRATNDALPSVRRRR